MSKSRTSVRLSAAVLLFAACSVFALLAVLSPTSEASTQLPGPLGSTSSETTGSTEPPTSEATSTEPPTTSPPTTSPPTTSRPTPTTSRSTTTTSRSSTTTTEEEVTTTTEQTTTTTGPPASLVLPPTETVPPRINASSGSGLSTDTKLALVVGGLIGVGVIIGGLTFLYWRHTRPYRYADVLGALDSVTDIGPVVPASAAASSTVVATPVSDSRASNGDDADDDEDGSDGDGSSGPPPIIEEPATLVTVQDLLRPKPTSTDGPASGSSGEARTGGRVDERG